MTVRREIAFVFVFIYDSFTTFEHGLHRSPVRKRDEEEVSSETNFSRSSEETSTSAHREIDPSGPRAYAKPWKMPV